MKKQGLHSRIKGPVKVSQPRWQSSSLASFDAGVRAFQSTPRWSQLAEVGSLWITLNYKRVRNGVAPLGYPLPHSWLFTTVNGVQEFLVDDPCSAFLRPKNWGLRMKRYGFREMRRINSVPTSMNRRTGLNIPLIITRKHSHVKHLRVYILQALRPVKHSAKVFFWSFWSAIATQDKSPCLIGAYHAFSGSNFISTSWSKGSLLASAHVRNLTTSCSPL